MPILLDNRASGLGLATVKTLLQADAYVAALDVSPMPFLEELQAPGARLLYLKVDVSQLEQIESAIEKVVAWSKSNEAHLGGVVTGAGISAVEWVRRMLIPFLSFPYHVSG